MHHKKNISYTTSNSYHTQGVLSENTKAVWIVFHGLGYLSKYFLRYFNALPTSHFVICPQAPSKHYLGTKFKHVGATWLTKEDTETETHNVLNYIDAIYKTEMTKTPKRLIILGYSQGVSIAARWLASRKIQCDHLVLHSGGIPIELKKDDFSYMASHTKVTYLYGDRDPYITEAKKTEEQLKATNLFGSLLETVVFSGVHEVNQEFIINLSE